MIACERVTEVLVAFDDDQLDAARTAAVEQHLTGCEACRRELQELRDAMSAVSDYLDSPAETAGAPGVTGHRGRAWGRLLAAAAVLFLVAGMGALHFFGTGHADAREITRQALERFEGCDNVRYDLSFVLPDGKAVRRGELVMGSGGRSLLRYSYAGIEYFFGNDGRNRWMGIRSYPGAPGTFAVGADVAADAGADGGMVESRIPDLHAWMKRFKEDQKAELKILLREKVGERDCTAIRASMLEEMGMKMVTTFWIDDEDRWVRRIEIDFLGMARVRLELAETDAEVDGKTYGHLHYATRGSRVIPRDQFLGTFGAHKQGTELKGKMPREEF